MGEYERIAGDLALDFANTMGGARGISPKESLQSYGHLVAWANYCELIGRARAEELIKLGETQAAAAQEVLSRAISLREAIYRVVSGSVPKEEDLFLLSREYQFAMGRARLTAGKKEYSWQWPDSKTDLDQMLWPVAKAATDLLTSTENVQFLKECEGDTCTWLFLDTSKNHRRRWCVMSDCGNRAKAKRFRAR